jgi:hypothetical protein
MASSDSENDFSFEKELAEYKEGKDIIRKKIDLINASKCLLEVVTLEKNKLVIDWSIQSGMVVKEYTDEQGQGLPI